MSNQADIRDIQVLGDLKAAFGRFGEELQQILPALQKQFEDIQEQLNERQKHWRQQADDAKDALYDARRSLDESQSQADDEDGHSSDCSFEEEKVADAERELAEYEDNWETVKQWRHRIESLIADFQNDIHRLSNLAFSRTNSAQTFLASKIEILDRYVGGSSAGVGISDLRDLSGSNKMNPDAGVASATAKTREAIRNAEYISCKQRKGGVNKSFDLKNGVKVVFKPSKDENPRMLRPGIRPGTQYFREKAASILDDLLGLGLVPPTEIITRAISGDDKIGSGEEKSGSAQLFKEDFETANRLHVTGVITLPGFERLTGRQRHDWQLLDELSGNMDRHNGNWMLSNRADGGFDLALIDNGLGFSETGATCMKAQPASQQKLDPINRSRVERLLATETEWRSKLVDLVGVAAVEHMLNRAQRLLTRNYYE